MKIRSALLAGGAIMFYMGILPVWDSLTGYIASSLNLRTTQNNMKINQIANELQQQQSNINAIGFNTDIRKDED